MVSASKITNDNDEFGFHDGWSSLEFRGNDNSFEEILWKIEKAKLQVNKLKTRMDKVVNENAGKYSSINKLMLVPCNASTSSARNPTSPSNGNRMPVGSLYAASQHVSDCNMGDLGMPETAASSHGEAIPVPDIIESTEQHQVGVHMKMLFFFLSNYFYSMIILYVFFFLIWKHWCVITLQAWFSYWLSWSIQL